jgi:hypothetical protein
MFGSLKKRLDCAVITTWKASVERQRRGRLWTLRHGRAATDARNKRRNSWGSGITTTFSTKVQTFKWSWPQVVSCNRQVFSVEMDRSRSIFNNRFCDRMMLLGERERVGLSLTRRKGFLIGLHNGSEGSVHLCNQPIISLIAIIWVYLSREFR